MEPEKLDTNHVQKVPLRDRLLTWFKIVALSIALPVGLFEAYKAIADGFDEVNTIVTRESTLQENNIEKLLSAINDTNSKLHQILQSEGAGHNIDSTASFSRELQLKSIKASDGCERATLALNAQSQKPEIFYELFVDGRVFAKLDKGRASQSNDVEIGQVDSFSISNKRVAISGVFWDKGNFKNVETLRFSDLVDVESNQIILKKSDRNCDITITIKIQAT